MKFILSRSATTENIYAGTLNKDGTWKVKYDVTDDFNKLCKEREDSKKLTKLSTNR